MNKKNQKIIEINWLMDKFLSKPSYFRLGSGKMASTFGVDRDNVIMARTLARNKINEGLGEEPDIMYNESSGDGKRNVLVISDTHLPAVHPNALKAMHDAAEKYNVTDIVHIGDVADFHAVSYHETDRSAYGVNDEIRAVRESIQDWYEAFPRVTVTVGNHGALIDRKAQSGNIPEQFIKPLNEVLGVPDWDFVDSITIGKVFFTHGIGMQAKARARMMGVSTVSGHYHSKRYIDYIDVNHNVFGMQVGCAVDKESYNMAYAKHSVIALGFGIILDVDHNPTPILMNIDD